MAIVVVAGVVVVAMSSFQLLQRPPTADLYYLAVLTALSSLLPVRLHRAFASISVSETFVFSAMLLHGPAAGAILASLDALLIWFVLSPKGVNWRRLFFSVAASALAMWVGGGVLFQVIGGGPFAGVPLAQRPDIWLFAGGLLAAATAYFLLNSWLVAWAISLEEGVSAIGVWRRNFTPLAPNYLAAASLAGLLGYNLRTIPLAFLVLIIAPLVVLLMTYRAATRRLQEAEDHVVSMQGLTHEVRAANTELTAALERLQNTQAQLIQSEKLSAVGLLVAGVAHEVNNPLTSIVGFAELLHTDLSELAETSESAKELVDMAKHIVVESDRAAKIVRNLLLFSRLESGDRQPGDLADLCGRVLELRVYEHRKTNITVVCDIEPNLPRVLMDDGQIQQVLLNLMANAERAMREGVTKQLSISVRAEPDCGTVLIDVKDTGHGIDPANMQRIFDPFFTTRPPGEGTGLGTSLVYGIVRDHGGVVTVTSQVSVGTTFTVRLPALPRDGRESARPSVLIASVESAAFGFLSAVLTAWGFDVSQARSAAEALAALAEGHVDLILAAPAAIGSDLDGWKKAWPTRQAQTSLVVVSTHGADISPDTMRFLREVARSTITLPYDHRQMRQAIGAAVEVRQ